MLRWATHPPIARDAHAAHLLGRNGPDALMRRGRPPHSRLLAQLAPAYRPTITADSYRQARHSKPAGEMVPDMERRKVLHRHQIGYKLPSAAARPKVPNRLRTAALSAPEADFTQG